MKTAAAAAHMRAIGARVVRDCCGNDGGLLRPDSSPLLFWLARQIKEQTP